MLHMLQHIRMLHMLQHIHMLHMLQHIHMLQYTQGFQTCEKFKRTDSKGQVRWYHRIAITTI